MIDDEKLMNWALRVAMALHKDPEFRMKREAAEALWGAEACPEATSENGRLVIRWVRRPIRRVEGES